MPLVTNSASYFVDIHDRDPADYGIGDRIARIQLHKNLGWSNYLNDVPEAFFTLLQDDPVLATIRPYLGRAHMRIRRYDPIAAEQDVMWSGWLGTELDQRGEDVIIYGHGYLSSLWYLHTSWGQSWEDSEIDDIVSDLLTRARTGIANSELEWVTPGVIQAPATTTGGGTPIILPTYQTYYKRILFALRDLSEIGRSDTDNRVVFEITPSGVFNFWGNKGIDRTMVFRYPSRELLDFRVLQTPIDRRNQLLAVGNSPRDLLLRTEQSSATGLADYGRRQEAILLQWVRDQTELERIAKLRLKKANREYYNMMLMFAPGAIIPPGHSFSPFELGDKVRVIIDKGATNIFRNMLISGIQVLFLNGVEHTRLLVEDT